MAHKRVVLCLLGTVLAASMLSGCAGKKSDPVTITVWTYYNGISLTHSTIWQRNLMKQLVGSRELR